MRAYRVGLKNEIQNFMLYIDCEAYHLPFISQTTHIITFIILSIKADTANWKHCRHSSRNSSAVTFIAILNGRKRKFILVEKFVSIPIIIHVCQTYYVRLYLKKGCHGIIFINMLRSWVLIAHAQKYKWLFIIWCFTWQADSSLHWLFWQANFRFLSVVCLSVMVQCASSSSYR